MAPIGRSISCANSPFSKGENCSKMIKEDEIKEEPPDDDIYHLSFLDAVQVKVEEEDDLTSFAFMNNDEDHVLKQEEVDHHLLIEEEKPVVHVLDKCALRDGGNGADKTSDQNASNISEDTSNSLLCKVCGKQFFRAFYFNTHMKTHQDHVPVNSPIVEKPHKCHECGKSFAFLQHLAGHSRIHIVKKYYECPVCRRKFTELSNLTMHLLKTHPEEKPYKCSECEKQFTQSSALKKHLRTHNSVTSQEELDRIDMMFFVNDKSEKDVEEPVKKKIKLELEEDKISPVKEKLPFQKEDKGSPSKDNYTVLKTKSPLSKAKRVVPKTKSPARGKLVQSSGNLPLSDEQSESITDDTICKLVESRNGEDTVAGNPQMICPVSLQSKGISNLKVSSLSFVSSSETGRSLVHDIKNVGASKESLPSSNTYSSAVESASFKDGVSYLEHSVLSSSNKECSIKESPHFHQMKESMSQRNGVPLDQVHSPQIKIMKFAKIVQDSEPLSAKGQSILSSLKSMSGVHQTNLDTAEVMEETENSNVPLLCNSDRSQKGRSPALLSLSRNKSDLFVGWEKNKSESREPFPSVEKPDGDYEIKYKCHRCEIFLESEEKLHNHLMDHTGVKLCECRFCGKDFTTLNSLKRHLYLHVVGAIPQDCSRCGITFSSFRDLKDHCISEKCETLGNAMFKCFRCRKQTSSLKKLKVHLLSECNDEPVKYYFPKKSGGNEDPCPSVTETSISPDVHSTQTLSENADSVKVSSKNEWITQKFEKSDSLSHSDIQELNCDANDAEALMVLSALETEKGKECWNLVCERCGQKFENAAKAKVHSQVGCGFYSESTELKNESEDGTVKIKVVFEEDDDFQCYLNCAECDMKILGVEKMLLHIQEHIFEQNTLTCPVLKCEKLFKDPKEFKLHLKAHTGHKPFKCSDCGKRFFLRENYENHAKRHGILKNWSSLNSVLQEKFGKSFGSARSPITIESSIVNLEVSEANLDKPCYSTNNQAVKPLERVKEAKKPLQKSEPVGRPNPSVARSVHTSNKSSQPYNRQSASNRPSFANRHPSVNRPTISANRPSSSVKKHVPSVHRTSLSVNRPSTPVKKSSPPVKKSSPPVNSPSPPVNRPSPPVNRPSPPVNRPSPPVNRPSPPVNRPSPSVNRPPSLVHRPSPSVNRTSPPTNGPSPTIKTLLPVKREPLPFDMPPPSVNRHPSVGSSIVNRMSHPSTGSLSVTPQGIFSVTPPRTYPGSSLASGPKTTFLLASTKINLNQKEPSVRVHPPSYYRLTEHARANIQAANAELRKYPRSGRCDVCKKTCSRLDKHMMVHLNQKPHLCPICPQAFRQSEHLRRHIRARHEGNHRQFECPQCHKRLTRKDKLKEHMKNCCRILATATLGDSLFDLIPGPSHLSEPPLQGHIMD